MTVYAILGPPQIGPLGQIPSVTYTQLLGGCGVKCCKENSQSRSPSINGHSLICLWNKFHHMDHKNSYSQCNVHCILAKVKVGH